MAKQDGPRVGVTNPALASLPCNLRSCFISPSQEPTTKPLLRAKVSRAGLSSPSLAHCRAGWAHGEEPESHGSAEFTTGVWRTSKGTAVGLSASCLTEIFRGLPCLQSWDMAKELRGAHLQLLGTGRRRMGNDGTTRKSFCRPPTAEREAVPRVMSPKQQPLYAVVLASRHQMSSWP